MPQPAHETLQHADTHARPKTVCMVASHANDATSTHHVAEIARLSSISLGTARVQRVHRVKHKSDAHDLVCCDVFVCTDAGFATFQGSHDLIVQSHTVRMHAWLICMHCCGECCVAWRLTSSGFIARCSAFRAHLDLYTPGM